MQPTEFQEREKHEVLRVINDQIAKKGQKPLSYAVKIISRDDLNQELPNEDSPGYRQIFKSDLIYLATFGLNDPLRENITDTINLL